MTEIEIRGRRVEFSEGATPSDARLAIDGKNIPLVYHEGFQGWGVEHTVYGFFRNLKTLAEHIISSNPSLVLGHDHQGGGHDTGGHDTGGHDTGGHDTGGHDTGGHDTDGHPMRGDQGDGE